MTGTRTAAASAVEACWGPQSRRRGLKAGLLAVGAAVGLFLLLATCLVLFPRINPAPQVDALLVLYTEDAVYDRAVELANEGVTDLLIVSQPDGADDRLCGGSRTATETEVVCFSPEPVTTQGEAIIGSELARDRGVETLGLLTFDNHLERARVVVSRCWDFQICTSTSLHGTSVSTSVPTKWSTALRPLEKRP